MTPLLGLCRALCLGNHLQADEGTTFHVWYAMERFSYFSCWYSELAKPYNYIYQYATRNNGYLLLGNTNKGKKMCSGWNG